MYVVRLQTVSAYMLVFGLWEETPVHQENPNRHWLNMQILQRKAYGVTLELNP